MVNFKELADLLATPQKIIITTHQKPDADALGSSLALANYLLQYQHHTVKVITPTDYPHFLTWMKGNNDVIVYEETAAITKKSNELIADADLIFCLDFSALHRIKDMGERVRDSKAKKVLIDHHIDPEDFAEFVLHDDKASSTAELIYDFIELAGDTDKIDKHIGECIYAGIMTDTGSFRFPSTTKKVHLLLADLFDKGIDHSYVHRIIYDDNNMSRLQILGHALSQKLKVFPEYNTAYIYLSKKELQDYNSQTGDTEGVVNYALSLRGIIFAVLFIEGDGLIKLSCRSVGDFAVNEFANTHFEGGGHKNAAGGRSLSTLEETIEKFEALLPQYQEELSACKASSEN
ncbi:MAG: bifunctional oligoribonuclease/PAP phosphatase NrnA [Cytophagales bacterium]|nr:bifunctional oligoribonuclease/PAP phosphatase NrnA [Cytophagales bacterium]